MKILNLFLTILSLTNNFVSIISYTNQSLPNSAKRRIGGTGREASVYPPYVVGIRNYDYLTGYYKHKCMGTLISKEWTISAKHCFVDLEPKDVSIYHGTVYYVDATRFTISQIIRHDKNDIALVKHQPINIEHRFFPKLTTLSCPADVRTVYHSWGDTGSVTSQISTHLLHSSNDVNEYACGLPEEFICFKPVDGSLPLHGDSGSGFITGYGPGPTFPDSHDVKIIAVIEGFFERSQFNTTEFATYSRGVRLSEFILWVKQYVGDVGVVG